MLAVLVIVIFMLWLSSNTATSIQNGTATVPIRLQMQIAVYVQQSACPQAALCTRDGSNSTYGSSRFETGWPRLTHHNGLDPKIPNVECS